MRSFLFLLVATAIASPGHAADVAAQLRRPAALVESAGGTHLYVANRDSGSLSVIDLSSNEVCAEVPVGKRLVDLQALGADRLLAVDEAAHEVVLLKCNCAAVEVSERLAVSPYPVSICLAGDGRQATIASLWSRRLTFVGIADTAGQASPAGRKSPEPALNVLAVLDLPFAPRAQLLLPGRDRLLVADAFGGRLILVEPSSRKAVGERAFPGHNVRGIGISPDGQMLMVAHQMLNELAHSIRNDIHWGLLMSNDLRWLKVDSVLAGGKELYHGAHMHPLGEAGKGGGDPGSLDVSEEGIVCVAISGVNQIAIGREGDFSMYRLAVGKRPTAVRLSRDGRTAFVANTFDDSISIVDIEQRKVTATLSLGPHPDLTVAQQGELLFHDARLSHDGWMSCQSCHSEGHANGQMNDNFSDRSFGAPKRVLSLLGVKDTLPLAWSGKVTTLERQIHNSVENTMQREETLPREQVDALAAYMKTLELPPPLGVLRGNLDPEAVERGRVVFESRDCANCHAPPTYTSTETYDVGLKDSQGVSEFNPPSLRGVSHRGPFFHDNSAETLEDVFQKSRHPSAAEYSADEVRDLAEFLRSL
jgi:YVTN family beta-propeller protein